MSSAKYLQKRVGYLGAVQSFRPETEVLMLATNLLKKVGVKLLLSCVGSSDEFIGHCILQYPQHIPAPGHPAAHHHTFTGYVFTS